jgi:Flp pilus assembly protein CpaB
MFRLHEVARPMVMTRPTDGARATEAHEAPPRRVVQRTPGVPGSRAVVGGALIALAAVGTFVSWRQASSPSQHTYAVATHALQPGDPLTSDDIRYEHMDLPAGVAGRAFDTPADPEGRVLVAPVGEGELLQDGVVSDQGDPDPAAEVSLALARDLAVDGRLQPGDTVDVYATQDETTTLVAGGVRVIAVSDAGGSFADGSELTVTVGLDASDEQAAVIHAARAGEVTLVRTTHVPRSSSPSPSATSAPPTAEPSSTGTDPTATTIADPTSTPAMPGGPG